MGVGGVLPLLNPVLGKALAGDNTSPANRYPLAGDTSSDASIVTSMGPSHGLGTLQLSLIQGQDLLN